MRLDYCYCLHVSCLAPTYRPYVLSHAPPIMLVRQLHGTYRLAPMAIHCINPQHACLPSNNYCSLLNDCITDNLLNQSLQMVAAVVKNHRSNNFSNKPCQMISALRFPPSVTSCLLALFWYRCLTGRHFSKCKELCPCKCNQARQVCLQAICTMRQGWTEIHCMWAFVYSGVRKPQ